MVPSDENGRMITSELERLVIDRKNKGIEAKLMDFFGKNVSIKYSVLRSHSIFRLLYLRYYGIGSV